MREKPKYGLFPDAFPADYQAQTPLYMRVFLPVPWGAGFLYAGNLTPEEEPICWKSETYTSHRIKT